jgi:hypothetical protein
LFVGVLVWVCDCRVELLLWCPIPFPLSLLPRPRPRRPPSQEGGQEGETQTPKCARKPLTGRRVAVPEELGRRYRASRRWLATTSYKINALPQPLLRLQRPQRAVHHPHKLCLQESELELKLQPPMAPRNSTPFHDHDQPPTAIPRLFHDHLTTQNSTHIHTKRQA